MNIKIMIRYLCSIALLSVISMSTIAQSNTTPAAHGNSSIPKRAQQLAKQIEKQPVLISQFIQTKIIAGMNKPVISEGRLISAHKKGIVWQIQKPLQVSYVIQDQQITEIRADGHRQIRDAKNTPAIGQLGKSLSGLMTLNTQQLEEFYEFNSTESTNAWEITLIPKSKSGNIKQIYLRGNQFLETIQLDDKNGDQTKISLQKSQYMTALPEAETIWFK